MEINKIKTEMSEHYNNLNLEKIVKIIKEDITDLDIKTADIKYYYQIKKIIQLKKKSEKKIIIIGKKTNFEMFEKDKTINEFFIDISFKIIPHKFRPNKMLTISFLLLKYFVLFYINSKI